MSWRCTSLWGILNKFKQSYWIIRGRQTVKKVLSRCIICKIVQGKVLLLPSIAKPPEYRLYVENTFENVGLDYAGPLFTRDIFGKSRETFKSYILIFTCSAAWNTHLELVPSESSDILLLAIRRFIATKGLPIAFISDNFKTFFFLPRFSFTHIHDSQHSRGRGKVSI